ncbi:hypothetical protein BHE74_00034872 [Ensete ventricosum]|uniref:Uncharacterized protein n=1 Tax=Ensete ventricosum TaxID=4639 RepID=A0A444DIA1_ENSVE|nr:hypothetical protein B296_00046970 [Ensete ventricosum]RWV97823.1 hypothetical protein GW17_00039367 [Ensete ventricosum]RWW58288.1 hypothetical protein BHE74_00034872 [Ensete ventricosum]RZS21000.1 hypothetical protein BHM03_00053581 [Ensete ventricosum]
MPSPRRRRIQSLVAAIDNKENIHPSRAAPSRRRPRNRKSPLPSWYPRTPLRDITIIVNALERRKRERAARDRQRNANPEASPVTTHVSDASSSSPALSTLSSLAPSSSDTLSTTERVPADPSTEDPKPTEFEKKLESTISEMERLVLDNLKRSTKPPARKATRTLMLMR